MPKLIYHLAWAFCLLPLACKAPTGSCIDPTKINEEAICTMQYDPVCGCDGKTYSNPCFAERAGVTSYTKGACKP